jgi:hypothetical protein
MPTPSLFSSPPLQKTQDSPDVGPSKEAPTAPLSHLDLVPLTQDDVKQALPSHLRASVTQTIADTLNSISGDPLIAQNIRDNFVGYSAVLREGKFKTEDYIHAVAYVSFKLMGHNNEDSYARAFPQRYAALLAKGTSKKDISAYVSAYHRGKLVNLIMEQSLVPTWVLNQDLFQKALNIQAELMLNASSEKVRTEAANSLLTHLKKPETKGGFQINLNTEDTSGMKEMRDTLRQLAQQQRDMIEVGQMRTVDVAASRLIPKPETSHD